MSDNFGKAVWPGWETVRLIGRGTFGAVYEIGRDVFGHREKAALKVITIPQSESDTEELISDGYDEESITKRFEGFLQDIVREYSMMADMKGCANIVNCDDVRYVQHDDGMGWDIFIKMELLTSLPKALGKTIPEEQVIRIGRDICSALIFCEQRNVIHRDIKPQNIFVAPDGTYKLGDFGIAKTAERTTSGTKTGTYKYMAPEVYNSRPYGGKADVCSLGLVLYWLLNERRTPFLPLPPQTPTNSDEDDARQRRFRGEKLPAPLNGSKELKQIVLKACAYDPADRYRNAEEMLRDLEALGKSAPPKSEPYTPAGMDLQDYPGQGYEEEDDSQTNDVFRENHDGDTPGGIPDKDGTLGFSRDGRSRPEVRKSAPPDPIGWQMPQQPAGEDPRSQQSQAPKKRKWWIFGIAAAVVVVLCLVLLILPRRGQEPAESKGPSAEMQPTPTPAPTPMPTPAPRLTPTPAPTPTPTPTPAPTPTPKSTTVDKAEDKRIFNGHEYQVFDIGLSWDEAKTYCEELNGHLVIINDAKEQNFIADLLSGGGKKQYWLGAKRTNGVFQWIDGTALSYTNWDYGQPDNFQGKESYLQIYAASNPYSGSHKLYFWNDVSLSNTTISRETDYFSIEQIGFICEWERPSYIPADAVFCDEGNYRHYFYMFRIESAYAWEKAESFCEEHGGHLATLTSKLQNQTAYSSIDQKRFNTSVYFGLSDSAVEGKWEWVTGEADGFSFWLKGEPNGGRNENYGAFYPLAPSTSNDAWIDADNKETVMCFICEWDLDIIN